MTSTTQRIAAAFAAILIATSSLTAIVTVPPADSAPAIASLATPDLA
ncbi:hypothetical protein AAG607_01590 [Citromicrobium bathyomarinum]|nr:hypothetical protein [Citromicrobium sp. JLT1363]|tara:strand:+ start:42 stop:182 length:141 start_codon:yes stop_codon:yes gene_type:complete